jgi:hypothetical protein
MIIEMTNNKRPLHVFLCHASSDKPTVQKLYKRLVDDGVDAWLDREKLIGGQDWQIEITKAIQESEVVIVCLSKQSVTKEGFVQKEIRFALAVADEKPEGTIFIIPTRLEVCDVPGQMRKFHWVDLFTDDGYSMLIRALQKRAMDIGATIKPKNDFKSFHLKYEKSDYVTREKSESQKAEKEPLVPEKIHRLIKYLKAFDYLHKKEPATVRSILVTVNKDDTSENPKSIKHFQDLAAKMLDNEIFYKKVFEYSDNLIRNEKTRDEFLRILDTRK